jgi:WD40 repeat protein
MPAMGAGKVGVWDSATGHCAHMLEGPGGTIEWLRWHPKGDVILAGSDDFTAWLWNAQTGTCMQVGNAWCLLHVPDSVYEKASS